MNTLKEPKALSFKRIDVNDGQDREKRSKSSNVNGQFFRFYNPFGGFPGIEYTAKKKQ